MSKDSSGEDNETARFEIAIDHKSGASRPTRFGDIQVSDRSGISSNLQAAVMRLR